MRSYPTAALPRGSEVEADMAGMDKLEFIERSEKLRLEIVMNYLFLTVLHMTFVSLLSPQSACTENIAVRITPRFPFQ